VRTRTYAEALKLINDNPYGNGTAIFTQNGGAARQFQFDVEVGMVGINVPIPVPVSYYSFGGWKGSLFGDLHMYGPDGIRFYTRTKVVTSRWPPPAAGRNTTEPAGRRRRRPGIRRIPRPARSTSGSRPTGRPRVPAKSRRNERGGAMDIGVV